jgi:hypothetical protein
MFSTHSEPISALTSNDDNQSLPPETILLQGVVFGRSVRMSFCSIVVSRQQQMNEQAVKSEEISIVVTRMKAMKPLL